MMDSFDHRSLSAWFLQEKRDLPWRSHPTPYAVWVSEVMLQQTQVAVVVPYFERWMQRFPAVKDLALASQDEVLKIWEGLGYYSRARNLYEGARYVLDNYGGEIPPNGDQLKKIKGLGPYTIGAILSFAFHQKVPAVDGNVLRVLARYYGIEDDIAKPKTIKEIWRLASELLPEEGCWIINEALIELGATICGRKARCKECPLRGTCQAYRQGMTDRLPIKSGQVKATPLYRAVGVIACRDYFLVHRVQEGKIMSGLHEFPYFETTQEGMKPDELRNAIQENHRIDVDVVGELPEVRHTFTRYRVRLQPVHFKCRDLAPVEDFEWRHFSEIVDLAFSSGHRRVLAHFLQKK